MKVEILNRNRIAIIFLGVLICFVIFFLFREFFIHRNQDSPRKENIAILYTPPRTSDHYRIKNNQAGVTIINYFSLDCVHCRQMYTLEETFLKTNPDELKNINIIYRHNPLEIHPLSQEKALISECVYQQGDDSLFFSFIGRVYAEYQNTLHEGNSWVKKLAEEYTPSQEKFNFCLESEATKNVIQKQKNDNTLQGIEYTPTILVFIDGKFIKKYENIGGKSGMEIVKHFVTISNRK